MLTECQAWETREKKLSMQAIVYFVIALSLLSGHGMREVWRRLIEGFQHIWSQAHLHLPTAGALCQRRKQLGLLPMRRLFERCARPLASPACRYAFR